LYNKNKQLLRCLDTEIVLGIALFSVAAELQNKLQELERHLNDLNERRMMLEVELSIIDTSDRKVVTIVLFATCKNSAQTLDTKLLKVHYFGACVIDLNCTSFVAIMFLHVR